MIEVLDQSLTHPIRHAMRPRHLLATATPSETVSTLMFKMLKENIGAVIIIEDTHPVGIITEKDILRRVCVNGKNLYTTIARDVMTQPLISIESWRSIRDALKIMQKHEIRRLAVVDEGQLVGIITERRLLAAIAQSTY